MSTKRSAKLQLEDIEAIKMLKARYGYYCDDSYNPDGISSLFIEDGVWDGEQFGRHEGRQAIHAFFHALGRNKIGFAMHLFMNPLIEVGGDTAIGHWYLLCPLNHARKQSGGLVLRPLLRGIRQSGRRVEVQVAALHPYFITPFDKGWAEKKFISR